MVSATEDPRLDFRRRSQPESTVDLRLLLVGWLRYQRGEFQRKLRDLSEDQLVEWSVPPVELSVLGLVRHLQQMEHAYLAWGLGGGERHDRYGDDDFAGGTPATAADDIRAWLDEVDASDLAIESMRSLDSPGAGHGRPLAEALIKMIDEYALHAGQAHMIRFAALGELKRD